MELAIILIGCIISQLVTDKLAGHSVRKLYKKAGATNFVLNMTRVNSFKSEVRSRLYGHGNRLTKYIPFINMILSIKYIMLNDSFMDDFMNELKNLHILIPKDEAIAKEVVNIFSFMDGDLTINKGKDDDEKVVSKTGFLSQLTDDEISVFLGDVYTELHAGVECSSKNNVVTYRLNDRAKRLFENGSKDRIKLLKNIMRKNPSFDNNKINDYQYIFVNNETSVVLKFLKHYFVLDSSIDDDIQDCDIDISFVFQYLNNNPKHIKSTTKVVGDQVFFDYDRIMLLSMTDEAEKSNFFYKFNDGSITLAFKNDDTIVLDNNGSCKEFSDEYSVEVLLGYLSCLSSISAFDETLFEVLVADSTYSFTFNGCLNEYIALIDSFKVTDETEMKRTLKGDK